MTRPAHRVGVHASIGGGLTRAVDRARARSCDALQIFPSNPRGWALPSVDRDEEAALRGVLEADRWPLFLHAPYLVNLAAPDDTIWHRSAAALDFALGRAERLGAAAVVVHAGHARGSPRDEALRRVAALLRAVLDRHPGTSVALEPTAGARGAVAGTPDDMRELLDAVDAHPRVGFCLDTCHLWAAGVDYSDEGVLAGVRSRLAELEGRLPVVHLNDSKDPCGSRRDRHEDLGSGEIDLAAMRALVSAPELRGATLLLETPGNTDRQRADVELVRSWG